MTLFEKARAIVTNPVKIFLRAADVTGGLITANKGSCRLDERVGKLFRFAV